LDRARTYLPAALGAVVIAAVATWVAAAIGPWLSPLLVALVIGAVVANVVPGSAALTPGAAWLSGRLLRAGIVLLGARVSLDLVAAIGLPALAVVALTIASVLTFVRLAGRPAGLSPTLAILIGAGTAICGNTAIAAIAPIIGAKRSETAFAIATITVFGTLALLAYPVLGHALGLSDRTFGLWAGAGVHDTSQVVATGFAFSTPAGEVATVVKLARNALIAPLLVGAAILVGRDGDVRSAGKRAPLWTIAGFLALAAANSAGLLDPAVRAAAATVSGWALTAALAAVGLTIRIEELRGLHRNVFLVGFGASVVGGLVALLAATAIGG
jgi:uncharacterized integral membrane protein (TIGR00698 family)